ncbi:hypothetical protein A3L04_06155 [Thermococcus chitonophagus]|uniref:Uncharacterized protein n=1 Tax=Thermococcus chitonophagus TaxID=54262 RepID=A0A160VR28_9EURY|nr:hypothetical protein [Thermococcus chitonophagus]ASJ16682.1 hypothetical protein A3L04_06155 [Thermococcus chitonophagus]CUX77393.1 hypothetical protein CHITON_0614 [Thermococcus chitonophagus]
MVIEEAIESVSSIPDPYMRIVTYGRIGVSLAKANDPRYEKVFKLAFEELSKIEDPYILLRSLLVIGYSTSLAGFKSSKKAFREVMINSEMLPPELRDSIRAEAVDYLVSLRELEEALFYALEIKDKKIRNEKLLKILEKALDELGGEKINIIYKKRKVNLILEAITDEPYRSEAIVKTIRPLLSVGDYRRVIELVQEISSRPWLRQALAEILLYLKQEKEEHVQELVKFSKELAIKVKEDIREDLAYIFAIHGFIDHSVDIIEEISNPEFVLKEIFEVLLTRNPKKLRDFLERLSPGLLYYLKQDIIKMLNEGDENLKEIVDVIAGKNISEDILIGAVKYYLSIDDLQNAMKVMSNLKSEKARSIALGFLAHYLIKVGNIGDAVDIVLSIKDKRLASRLASEILVKVVEGSLSEVPENLREKERAGEHPISL